jgi:hypothetical protein
MGHTVIIYKYTETYVQYVICHIVDVREGVRSKP